MCGECAMTADSLIRDGYEIIDMQITSVDLSINDHGYMMLAMTMECSGRGIVYGSYCLGHSYFSDKVFDGSKKPMPCTMNITNVVGVERFNDMKGKYVRVAIKRMSSSVKIIGNIIEDKWFDPESFFKN